MAGRERFLTGPPPHAWLAARRWTAAGFGLAARSLKAALAYRHALAAAALGAAVLGLWGADGAVLQAKHDALTRQALPIPTQVGHWKGTTIEVRPEEAALLPRTEITLRRYRRASEPETLGVDLAAVSASDLSAFHNPDSCYRAAGWSIIAKGPYPIPVGPGKDPVAAERLVVEKNGYRLQVLCWYSTRSGDSGALGRAHASRAGVFVSALRWGGAEPATFFRVTTLAADGETQSLLRSVGFIRALMNSISERR